MDDITIPADVRVLQIARELARHHRAEPTTWGNPLLRSIAERLAIAVDRMNAEDDEAVEAMSVAANAPRVQDASTGTYLGPPATFVGMTDDGLALYDGVILD